jgi:hypothetical protein
MNPLESQVLLGLAQQGIHLNPLSHEEKPSKPKREERRFNISDDELRDLAIKLQNIVIWRGCGAGGTFDENYHTPEYHLFSDEWEPFHIRVTRKKDGRSILSAMDNYYWSGTEYDYKALLRLIDNHNKLLPLMRKGN